MTAVASITLLLNSCRSRSSTQRLASSTVAPPCAHDRENLAHHTAKSQQVERKKIKLPLHLTQATPLALAACHHPLPLVPLLLFRLFSLAYELSAVHCKSSSCPFAASSRTNGAKPFACSLATNIPPSLPRRLPLPLEHARRMTANPRVISSCNCNPQTPHHPLSGFKL